MTPGTARSALIAVLVLVSVGAGFAIHALSPWPAVRREAAPRSVGDVETVQSAFVSVAARVRPSVVNVGTVQVAHTRRAPMVPGPFADDPFFKDFFDQFFGRRGPAPPEEYRQSGLGSGVIVDKRGYVLTNFHVVRGADAVTVRLSSKQEFRGKVVGTDPKTDLAMIRFDPSVELSAATLGNSD